MKSTQPHDNIYASNSASILTNMVDIVGCNNSKIKPEIWSTYLRFHIAGIGGPKDRNECVSILDVIIFSF
jgi:hypothetical protein